MISSIRLTDFRCFDTLTLECTAPVVLIEGPNGSGKTSLLEALHYAGYVRSFRTHVPREMIAFEKEAFVIEIQGMRETEAWHLQIGCSSHKRLVKVNGKATTHYKELIDYYTVVSILEADLDFVTGAPEMRRGAIDQALVAAHPETALYIKKYRTQLEQRNALLHHQRGRQDQQVLAIWTEQLWNTASLITQKRIELIQELERQTNALAREINEQHEIAVIYQPKVELGGDFGTFSGVARGMFDQERMLGRTLFGPHLDDIIIHFKSRSARTYASRGQQKLVMFLFKLAQCLVHERRAVLLLDDLLADFDYQTLEKIIPLALSLAPQVFITTPIKHPLLLDIIKAHTQEYKLVIF